MKHDRQRDLADDRISARKLDKKSHRKRRGWRNVTWLLQLALLIALATGCDSGPRLDDNGNQQTADGTNAPGGDASPGNQSGSGTQSQSPDETANGTNASNGTNGAEGSTGSDNATGSTDTTGSDNAAGSDNAGAGTNQDQEADDDGAVSPPVDHGSSDATWIAVGDIMMHTPQLPGAYDAKTGSYDFKPFFAQVKPILEQGDWTLANLETPIAGKALGLSGYPRFNAPPELADAMKYAGFTTVTNANNHALDRGAQGVSMTLDKLQTLGFEIKGTARSLAESEKLTILKRGDISMGLLAYTYGTNGIPLPKDQPYAVSLIDEAKMIADIKRLKAAGADFITVSLHFGIEYQTKPNDAQIKLARDLVAAGADIIAGSHPHVVQPYEIAEVTNADGSVRKGLIIYSMGNFISNQKGDTKDYGVIFKARIHKDNATGKTSIADVKAITTWVHRTSAKGVTHYAVVPVQQALASKSLSDLSAADLGKLKSTYAQLDKRLRSMHAKPVQLQAGS